jgi:tetratricopeptide (TPR) repeat protein
MRDWLSSKGWGDIFLDLDPRSGISAGENWQEALKRAADRCQAVLFLISREWLASRWCLAEFLLAKQLGKRLFPLIIDETPTEALPLELTANHQAVNLANDPEWEERLAGGLRRAGLDPETFPFASGRRPYPGFEPLTEEDAAIYFGREAQIVRGLDRLRNMSDAGVEQILVILGASGAGKSSFLRAGLWPRLKRDDRNFLPLPVIRPEREVVSGKFGLFSALEQSCQHPRVGLKLAEHGLARSRGGIGDIISSTPEALLKYFRCFREAHAASLVMEQTAAQPVLVISIDQAEELFNEEGSSEANLFMELLAKALSEDRRVLVILALRSDAFPRLQTQVSLAAVRKEPFDLPPMPAGSLRLVIEGPAQVARPPLKLDPKLVDALLEDASGEDTLPLLAFTLGRLLRDYGADGALNLAEYEKLGRSKGAVDAAVSEVLKEGERLNILPKEKAAQDSFLRETFIPHLARINRAGQFVRRVASKAEIPSGSHRLIDLFVEARLLVKDRRASRSGEIEIIEVAHEALLREWPVLRGWLEADREFLLAKELLADDLAAWESAAPKDKPDALLSGLKLTRAGQWLKQRAPQDFSGAERQYIQLSLARADSAQRRARRLRAAAAVMLVSLTGFAMWQWRTATRRLELARDTSQDLVALIAKDLQTAQGIKIETVQRILDKARSSFDRLASALSGDQNFEASRASMLSQFGEAYLKAGDLKKAEDSYDSSLRVFQNLAAKDPGGIAWQRGIADQIDNLGVVRQWQNRLKDAFDLFNGALARRSAILKMEPDNPISHRDISSSSYNLGEVLRSLNRPEEALTKINEALKANGQALALDPGNLDLRLKLSLIYVSLGTIYHALHREDERLKSNLEALAIRKSLVELSPDNADWKRLLSWAYEWAGHSYEDVQKIDEASKAYEQVLSLRLALVEADPSNRRFQYDLALAYHFMGSIAKTRGEVDKAKQHLTNAYKIREALHISDPANARWTKDLALSAVSLGEFDEAQQKLAEALGRYEAARDLLDKLVMQDHANMDWRAHLAWVYNKIGHVLKVKEDLGRALENYEHALVLRREILAQTPNGYDAISNTATSEFLVGEAFELKRNLPEALVHFKASQSLRKQLVEKYPSDIAAQNALSSVENRLNALPASSPERDSAKASGL